MRRTTVNLAPWGWRYKACGPPGTVLKQDTWPAERVSAGGVRVKMEAAPVLGQDVLMVMGKYGGYKAEEYPAVAGTEGTGEVVEAGAGSRLKKGAKVIFSKQNLGTWSTEVTVADDSAVDDISDLKLAPEQAAVLPLYASAVRMAADFGDVSNKICWVLGSDLPLGSALVAALKSRGPKEVRAIPQDGAVPESDAPNFIFNGVGSTLLRSATDAAAFRATVVTWGNAANGEMHVAGTRAVLNMLEMRSFWHNRWLSTSSTEERQQTYKEAASLLAGSKAVSVQAYPFDKFADAFDTVYNKGGAVPVVTMA